MLLEGAKGADARRLVATWPTVAPHLADDTSHESMIELWERVSGVHYDDIERLEQQLFANQLLGPDGFVAPEASDFVADHIAGYRKRLGRKSRARDDDGTD